MSNNRRAFVGLLLIVSIHVILAFMIFGYWFSASSTMKNSFFYISGEGAGLPMFYYYITFPVCIFLSIVLFFIKRLMSYWKVVSSFPIFIWLLFYATLETTNPWLLVPSPNDYFYIGSVVLCLILFTINLYLAFSSIKFSRFLYQL